MRAPAEYLAEVSRLRAAVDRIEHAMPKADTPDALSRLRRARSAIITALHSLHQEAEL